MAESWLVLLPRPPSEVCLETLQTAYRPSLDAILRDASKQTQKCGQSTKLDIGIAYPRAFGLSYASLQNLLALMYELTCILCTRADIDVQYDNDVDVRIFLFQDPATHAPKGEASVQQDDRILPSFASLAQIIRRWSRLCFVSSERGEEMLRSFTTLQASANAPHQLEAEVIRLPGGLSIINIDEESLACEDKSFARYGAVAVGGTFDHLHAGHKLLLTMSTMLCGHGEIQKQGIDPSLTIGITGDELLRNKKHRDFLESWSQRQSSVRTFVNDFLQLSASSDIIGVHRSNSAGTSPRTVLETFGSGLTIRYQELFDAYGPTIEDPDISVLVISAETRSGGDDVNAKRSEKGWRALKIFEVQVLDGAESVSRSAGLNGAEGFASKLSSTEIRSRISKKA